LVDKNLNLNSSSWNREVEIEIRGLNDSKLIISVKQKQTPLEDKT
jgi:hypothetical protein